MSDTKNDEKLRILQERLAQIKQKQDTPESIRQKKETVIEVAMHRYVGNAAGAWRTATHVRAPLGTTRAKSAVAMKSRPSSRVLAST